jgi:GLPGLI family protein
MYMKQHNNKITWFFVFFAAVYPGGAALSQTVNGLIYYRCISNTDTTRMERDSIGHIASMFFDSDSSLYTLRIDPDYKKLKEAADMQQSIALDTARVHRLPSIDVNDKIGYAVFKNLDSRVLTERNIVLINKTAFLHDETLPPIAWQLIDSFRTIAGFSCQKATGYFRGRLYIAWFASLISVTHGPWKLGGLPGLIMEAYDEKRQIQWLFEGIKVPVNSPLVIARPLKGRKISFKQYQTVEVDEFEKARKRYIATAPLARGQIMSITYHRYPLEINYSN